MIQPLKGPQQSLHSPQQPLPSPCSLALLSSPHSNSEGYSFDTSEHQWYSPRRYTTLYFSCNGSLHIPQWDTTRIRERCALTIQPVSSPPTNNFRLPKRSLVLLAWWPVTATTHGPSSLANVGILPITLNSHRSFSLLTSYSQFHAANMETRGVF